MEVEDGSGWGVSVVWWEVGGRWRCGGWVGGVEVEVCGVWRWWVRRLVVVVGRWADGGGGGRGGGGVDRVMVAVVEVGGGNEGRGKDW